MNRRQTVHPPIVRVTHWINALAILVMMTSGWRIYNASPLFPFRFPESLTLGGWLAGALQWHFAAMWLFAGNLIVYLGYGIFSGRFRMRLFPISARALAADLGAFFRGRLSHDDIAVTNTVQRLLYAGVILALLVLILSGLAIWKPIQFQELTALMGGYETARHVHFFAMAFTAGFALLHIAMAVLVPRSLLAMVRGR